jgi:4'-phosphopantetheinyl transferase EntD
VSVLAAALHALGDRLDVAVALTAVHGDGRAAERAASDATAIEALHAAGCDHAQAPGRADDGRPVWPAGYTGSIAHAGRVCVAVAVPVERAAAVGIDIEVHAALAATDARLVMHATEQARIDTHPAPDARATLTWSAKEAAFKAWSAATDGRLGVVDPVDIHVDADEPTGVLRVTAHGPLQAVTAAIGPLRGAFVVADGYVITLTRADPHAADDPVA